MPITALSLAVVGAGFPNADGSDRRFEILLCAPGEPIELRPEPKNKADPQAVAVYSCRGVQIGYVKAERAPLIRGWIVDGREHETIFQEATPWGAVVRFLLDGAEATLPPPGRWVTSEPPQEWVDPDPGFYPDELPPDW